MLRLFTLCGILFGMVAYLSAQETAPDFSTYEGRKAAVVEHLKDVVLKERGKHGIPRALARLANDPNDRVAIDYLVDILDPRMQTMFDFPGISLALYQYGDSFTPEEKEKIKSYLLKLAKPVRGEGEGFLNHGTENHAIMMWSGAFLYPQLWPDAQWNNGMNSEELKAHVKEWMRKTYKNVYRVGYAEYLSTTYEAPFNSAMETLYVYAEDPEMKAIAEAVMLYKWAILSLNAFDGEIMAPSGRMGYQIDHAHPGPKFSEVPGASFYNWVLWGWGEATDNMNLSCFRGRSEEGGYNETSHAIYAAISKAVPDDVFFQIAANKDRFTQYSSACNFGNWGEGAPRWMLRKVSRDKNFAIGAANFRWVPGGDYADHDACGFTIQWSSADRFNYINCFHPFWYAGGDDASRGPDTWNHGGNSPFQQTAIHENVAITVFDIPDKDPWPGKPSPEKWAWRNKHENDLLKRGMLRYPDSVDEQIEENNWIFLREGKTYIGIRPLKEYYLERDSKEKFLEGFVVVKSDHAQTGFVFELGSEEEFGNFASFRERVAKNKLDIDWKTTTVAYTGLRGDTLQIRFVPGLPLVKPVNPPDHWARYNPGGFIAESVPYVAINGVEERFLDGWPLLKSPFVEMDDSVLKIDDGKTKITVDWRGDYPKITRN